MPQVIFPRSGSLFSSASAGFGHSAAFALILFGYGCSSATPERDLDRPAARSEASPRAALLDGTLATRDDLWPLLAERAGAASLEAIALDRAVAREARRQGVTVDEDDLRAERAIVEQALAGVGLTDRQQRGRVVAEARARRGWGPTWFDALLRRNALARKLTSEDVREPTEADVERLYEVLYGDRREVRVLVMASEREVARLRADVAAALAESRASGEARFMVLAAEYSSDVSSARGGLLDPVGRFDVTYPDAFRDAVFGTPPGSLTPVVALDEGFAVAYVSNERPGVGRSRAAVRGELLDRLGLDAQQRAMATLFERLRASMRIEPLDESLRWSWEQRPRG
jgi:parvulin-like peptidyl-prolyl isomerase